MPPDAFPQSGSALFNAYKTKRIEDGAAPAKAEQLVDRFWQYAMSNPEFSTLFYNRQSAARNPMYASGTNAFLAEVVERLRPGPALDVGIGDGRNAIFLAQRGCDVTGIDLAEVGIAKAKKRAAELGLKLNALVQDTGKV